ALPSVAHAARVLRDRIDRAEQALASAPFSAQQEFREFAKFFDHVTDGPELYHAVLHRHAEVQKRKPPEGKRQWFEAAADGSVMVRIPYRFLEPPPEERNWWPRPYRLRAVQSFCHDLRDNHERPKDDA